MTDEDIDDIVLYDKIKNHIKILITDYFKQILNEQFIDELHIKNMILIIHYITMNLVFYDIVENIENLIDTTLYENIEDIKNDLLRMYLEDEFEMNYDEYKDDIVDIFIKYKIKIINHNFVIELNDVCNVYNLKYVF